MAQAMQPSTAPAAWEKPSSQVAKGKISTSTNRLKYMIGGGLILAAIAYLVISGTLMGASFFMTVDDLLANPEYVGQRVRITGAVIGDTIRYDSQNLLIEFTVANVPNGFDDLGTALHEAVNNPNATHLQIRAENHVKPELLVHEAQAIMTGILDENGVFHVSYLELKCPTRFIEGMPANLQLEGILEGS